MLELKPLDTFKGTVVAVVFATVIAWGTLAAALPSERLRLKHLVICFRMDVPV